MLSGLPSFSSAALTTGLHTIYFSVQDDRGAALSVARIEQLRAEVAALGRPRPAAPGR